MKPWTIALLLFSFLPVAVTVRIGGVAPDITIFDFLLPLIFAILLACEFFGLISLARDPLLGRLMLMWVAMNLLSMIANPDSAVHGMMLMKVMLFGYITYLLTATALRHPQDKQTMAKWLVLFACVVAGMLIMAFIRLWNDPQDLEAVRIIKDELGINIGRSNYIASLLVPVVPVSLAVALTSKRLRFIFWILATVVLLTAIAATMSKGAIVSLAFGALVAVPFYWRGLLRLRVFSGAAAICCLLVVFVPSQFLMGNSLIFSQFFTSGDPERLGLWRVAWSVFCENPFLGVGPSDLGHFTKAALLVDTTAHNWLLNSLAEVGLLGTLPLILIVVFLFIRAWKSANRSPLDVALLAAISATVFHGLVEPTFAGQQYTAVFWVIGALITCKVTNDRASAFAPMNSTELT